MRHLLLLLAVASLAAGTSAAAESPTASAPSFTLVVMDPLALPLSCPCVKGYAQRDYGKLREHLQARLGRPVQIAFSESLTTALERKTEGRADIVIGKRSVVEFDAKANSLNFQPIAALSGKDGSTMQTGLIVVRASDSAKNATDLKGYRIIFGPADCDEKHAAAMTLLKQHGVAIPTELETSQACSDGATLILEAEADVHAAAVISSYAQPLLEGCGTIKKGDLRVVGETAPVPFVTAFVSQRLNEADRQAVAAALGAVIDAPALCIALETKRGFVPVEARAAVAQDAESAKKLDESPEAATAASAGPDWIGWRGSNRDALVPSLPDRLPDKPRFLWQKRLREQGLSGVAATRDYVIVVDRELAGAADSFRCFKADTGEEAWSVRYLARGNLDYGNSPRATPLIHGELVILQGAFGHLHCVKLASGEIVWKKNLREEFGVKDELIWGMASSPLIADGKLIVSPGAKHSLVALEPATGTVLWQTPGDSAAFASFIYATLSGRLQLVGYDKTSLGGWDATTGQRLWRLAPPVPGDFNVPTPIAHHGRLIVCSENNGARAYEFNGAGLIKPQPIAHNEDLAPDAHTPVAVGNRLFGVWDSLVALDLKAGLKPIWRSDDNAFQSYSSIIASPERLLITTHSGELMLVDARADECKILSRLRLFEDDAGIYSHPALIGDRLYLRTADAIYCLLLGP